MSHAIQKRVVWHMLTVKAQISASAQSKHGLPCSLTELVDTPECMNNELAQDKSEFAHFAHA